ncbi:MAG: PEP-CTERM sorting domain-containing protein [Verrucomicrobiales bacterium]|nr:PEP-CTERM sorting domain-containing protein [Verrucomicrobiota bacterium JB025]
MKKKLLLAVGTLSLACVQAGATVTSLTLSQLDTNTQFGSSVGTAVSGSPGTLGLNSTTFYFTVNGLDLTGDATANDSVVFSFDITASGSDLVQNISGNAYSFGVDGTGDPTDHEIDPGETLTFSDLGINVTLGDSNAGTVNLNSAAFTGFNWRYSGGDAGETVDAEWTDGTETAEGSGLWTNTGGANARANFTTPQTAFTIAGGTAGSANGFGVDTIAASFEIEYIPEPSSFALLSLAGLGFLTRRRR